MTTLAAHEPLPQTLHFRGEYRDPSQARPLPAWPMQALLCGFPLWWAAGASPFAPALLAVMMAVLIFLRRETVVVPGIIPWFVFLAWALAAAVNLSSVSTAIGYAQRLSELFAVGIFMLYYINARELLKPRALLTGLMAVWATVVCLGLLAIQIPDFRLSTPVGALLPGFLTSNELVYDLVFPPLAEVQQPWGAPEPFNRPAAPFPYANGWGTAFVVLTPIALAAVTMTKKWWARAGILALIGISFWPALETSNRGMFVGLAASVMYVTVRMAFRGQLLRVALLSTVAAAGAAAFVVSGAAAEILARQEYSDSTGGRLALYRQTLDAAAGSPFLGYGAPRMEQSIGVSLGTQGYVWMLMFSYGFVGLGLFLLFLLGGILRTWSAAGNSGLWLHSVPVTALVVIPFYGLAIMQMTTVALVLAMLLRARYLREPLDA